MTRTRRAGRELLALPGFRRWYAARMTSLAGTAASGVAVPMLVWERTGSATATAAVSGLAVAPYLVFGLPAGAHADRVDRRRLMVGAEALAAALLATVPVAFLLGAGSTAHVLAVVAAAGSAFVWFDAAAFGALPQIVGKARLQQANSLIFATSTVVGIAAPALAAVLAALTSPAAVIGIDALTFAVSAFLLRRLALPGRAASRSASVRADIAEGLRFIWSEHRIRALTFAGFGIACSGGGALGLIVVHADELLDVDDWRLGLLYSATAAGSLLGALLLRRLTSRLGYGRTSIAVYALELAMILALATAGPGGLGLALLLWVAWDFAHTAAVVNGITVRQLLTPDDLQGRVNTTGRMIAWGGAPFGALAAGVLADRVGVQSAYLLLALPVAAGTAVLLASPVTRLRTIATEAAPSQS
ncbi:MFS transporter [Glycomyces sp. TRM65418]|uniref:MFS transporter n=1 Tax=Glycomyces sp. TRM65418 TaxID=2867006 RepID=UPI001CE56295|nr:MFS transporter [Glycomyces sp. TRM65418]MCC3764631.1 MFS transporter [Glycomyces sp. TRM65418]QZD54294.1 MFS transporter [Glycomyces sp. TRM65418]